MSVSLSIERDDDTPGLAALIIELRACLSLSLNDVALRVRAAALAEGVTACGVTRHAVHKWERGTVPRPDSLRWLAVALEVPVEVLVRALHGGRPRGPHPGDDGGLEAVKRRTFLHGSAALAGAAVIAPVSPVTLGPWAGRPAAAPDRPPELAALRDALLRPTRAAAPAGDGAGPLAPAALAGRVEATWRAYQDGRYAAAIGRLPDLLAAAQVAAREHDGEAARRAHRSLAESYQLVAGALRKMGDRHLSAIAADRSLRAAEAAGDPLGVAASARSLCIALFETGHHREAIEIATAAASTLHGDAGGLADSPEGLSVHGLLMLGAAEAAADLGDRAAADDLFREAEAAAARLGRDANHRHTAFGPTNVVVHRIHAAVLLSQPDAAVARARGIDLGRLPVPERRAHHLLDVAVSHGQMGRWDDTLTTLLRAEAIAADEVRLDATARGLVADLLRRTRRSSDQLRGLAGRIGLPG
jgi:tetratricopeptide (TPR) repeat protein